MRLSQETLQRIKLEYQREYALALKRLQDLKFVLDQLNDIPTPENVFQTPNVHSSIHSETKNENLTPTNLKPTAPKRTKGKRGRKSVWGKFILTRLKSVQKPLTLDELTNHAIVTMKIDPARFTKTRQSLVNAVFGLRQKGEVITVGVKGTREKVLALPQWLDERERLLPDYQV